MVQTLPFARILLHHKLSKPLSNIVLQGWFAQAATAFPVTGTKLIERRVYLAATFASAMPDQASASASRSSGIKRCQLSKSLSGNIPLSRLYHRFTTAVQDRSALQCPGIETNTSTAFTGAAPYHISVFSLRGRLYDGKLSNTNPRLDLWSFLLYQFIHLHPILVEYTVFYSS